MKPLTEERMISGADLVKRGVSLVGLHGRAVNNTMRCITLLPTEDKNIFVVDRDVKHIRGHDIPLNDPITVIGRIRGDSARFAILTPSCGIVCLNILNMEFPDPDDPHGVWECAREFRQ